MSNIGIRTGINVGNDHLCALVGKQACGLGADALSTASNDGDLASQHTLGVVEVAAELGDSIRHDGCVSSGVGAIVVSQQRSRWCHSGFSGC